MCTNLARMRFAAAAVFVAAAAAPASAQLDPLYFMRNQAFTSNASNSAPNVIFVVDTSHRMQRDAATDLSTPATAISTSSYYDPFVYPKTGALYEVTSLKIDATNTNASYRRKYMNLAFTTGGGDKYTSTTIAATGDRDPGYARFGAATRLSIARAAMYQAIVENRNVVRFGLVQMRQRSPSMPTTAGNDGPVADADPLQQTPTDSGSATGRWNITRPTVGGDNGGNNTVTTLIKADSSTANADVYNKVAVDIRGAWQGSGAAPSPLPAPLIPAGNDDSSKFDTPVKYMLDDVRSEVTRLHNLASDPTCRNTIVVLIVGGGEGNTAGYTNSDLGTTAAAFMAIGGDRIPIYVIAIAPPRSDVPALQAIATSSGGQYFEITKQQIDMALNSPMQKLTTGVTAPNGTVIVPDVVKAIDTAIQATFAASTDFNAGNPTEYQVTSPIIGTVNLNQAKDINGNNLYDGTTVPQPPDVKDKQGNVIPQRSNVMVTSGVAVPGFDARLRAFLVYKPYADSTQPSGYKFKSDGTRMWVASAPADANARNLFTSDPSGNLIPFTTGNTGALAPLMNLTAIDASNVIAAVRAMSLGAVIDSTPGFENPPSLDPPPDDAYPGFAVANKERRTLIWVGTNRGILEAIDARTGLEVWGFIPLNLLPKLRTLLDGQPVGSFDYFMDGSPKISDVRLSGICGPSDPSNCWRTHMIIGEGPGGTFYQSFDVTMDNIANCIAPDSNDTTTLLNCFNSTSLIKLNWAFPSYTHFDVCAPLTAPCSPIQTTGDVSAAAPAIEKTVGQTWSDPAVGPMVSTAGPYAVLLGSGFFPYSKQQWTNRAGIVAGTTFYIVDAKTGTVFSSSDVGSDGVNETNSNCRVDNADGCAKSKNALQTDPVATGPSDSRFITKAYLGDLDGNVWRFDVVLDGSNNPVITAKNRLYSAGNTQPIYSSMATVNVGGTNQYVFFGTGSDLLPATDKNTMYHLLGVLDVGNTTGTKSLDITLSKTNTLSADERVTAFPAVAGDIVFFTTTTYKTSALCSPPDANLYALTFIGGAAYDTNNDGRFSGADSVKVKTIAGQRATAPFIVDQHLVFGTQGSVSVFGDPEDFNNGVGQAGVRILSWREVR